MLVFKNELTYKFVNLGGTAEAMAFVPYFDGMKAFLYIFLLYRKRQR